MAPERTMQRIQMQSELKGLGWVQRSKSRKKEQSAPKSLHVEFNQESKPEPQGPPLHIADLQEASTYRGASREQQSCSRVPVISGKLTNEAYFNKTDFLGHQSNLESFKNRLLGTEPLSIQQQDLDKEIEFKKSLLMMRERTGLKKSESASHLKVKLQNQTPTFQNEEIAGDQDFTEFASHFRAGPVSTRNLDSVRLKKQKVERAASNMEQDLQKWKHVTHMLAASYDEINRQMKQLKEEKEKNERRLQDRIQEVLLENSRLKEENEGLALIQEENSSLKEEFNNVSKELKKTTQELFVRLESEQSQREAAVKRANKAELEVLQMKQYFEKSREGQEKEKQQSLQKTKNQEMLVFQLSQQVKAQKGEIEKLKEAIEGIQQSSGQKKNKENSFQAARFHVPNSARLKPQYIEHCWNQVENEQRMLNSPPYSSESKRLFQPAPEIRNPFTEANDYHKKQMEKRSITKIMEVKSEYSESSIADEQMDSIPREYDSSSAESYKNRGSAENRYKRQHFTPLQQETSESEESEKSVPELVVSPPLV